MTGNYLFLPGLAPDPHAQGMQPGDRVAEIQRTIMIRVGQQVRLTRRQVERFIKITGIPPAGIHSLAELDAYIAKCKAHYWGVSRDTQFLHWLIDREYHLCHQAV